MLTLAYLNNPEKQIAPKKKVKLTPREMKIYKNYVSLISTSRIPEEANYYYGKAKYILDQAEKRKRIITTK